MVEDYIYNLEGQQKKIMQYLHELLTIEYGLQAKIRFKIPFYYGNTWVCYLNKRKHDRVDFAIVRGREILNGHGLLESRGRAMVLSTEFASIKEIPLELLREVIEEAMFLDETKPYTFVKKKKK